MDDLDIERELRNEQIRRDQERIRMENEHLIRQMEEASARELQRIQQEQVFPPQMPGIMP